MSKSLGNGIDPLEVIDKYGADALRFTLVTGNAPGNDMRFYWERVEASRNFANKVWNASRFIMMNMDESLDEKEVSLDSLKLADKWILKKYNQLVAEVTANMDKFELGVAVAKLYDFIWEDFCNWYIELSKVRFNSDDVQSRNAALWTLKTVLTGALKLLHPYMPFITEEIYVNLTKEESIMISSWPVYNDEWNFEEADAIESVKEVIRSVRNVRSEMNVALSKKIQMSIVTEDDKLVKTYELCREYIENLCNTSALNIQKDKSGIADDAVSTVIPNAVIYMPFAEMVDIEKEVERLKKEEERLKKELARSNGMLNNEKFMSKAPEAKVAEERAKLEKYEQMMEQVKLRLEQLQGK